MYLGAGFALAGAAFFYGSWALLGYTGLFFLATHLFVTGYEEPTLRDTFGPEYEAYCRRVRRWRPRV
jgi:protein-S-isoprenylcysteine O-methyltransferase Ste14